MTLDESLENPDEDLIPSFKDSSFPEIEDGDNHVYTDKALKILVEFENKVVPNIIGSDWMSQVAKSMDKPYYNSMDQNLNSHIFPGVEIICGISEKAYGVDLDRDLRNLIALWTIHDIHKIYDKKREFSLTYDDVKKWVNRLGLDDFSDNINIKDFHSCAVALHSQGESNIDDSTVKFTNLRPILRLTDLILSIDTPSKFVEAGENLVSKVFNTPDIMYVPSAHEINIKDSVIRSAVNKSLYQKFNQYEYIPIDFRDDGILYVRPENKDPIDDLNDFMSDIVEQTFLNLKDSYQIFSNKSLLCGNINSPQTRSDYPKMPRVYDISEIESLCLDRVQIIQRIVQAAIDQQNHPWDISTESKRQINMINKQSELSIEKSSLIEGFACLVNTVYQEILPKLIKENSEKPYERTLEGAILYVFDVDEKHQNILISCIENNKIPNSKIDWIYRYVIADYLDKKYMQYKSSTDRQSEIMRLILDRLSDFDDWNKFGNKSNKVRTEFYIRVASRTKIDGENVIESEDLNILEKVNDYNKKGNCYLCSTSTTESSISPSVLTYKDYSILNYNFVTENSDGKLEEISLEDSIPYEPICVTCQIALSARSQQLDVNRQIRNKNLHISVKPINSTAISSYTRFERILQAIKTKVFSEDNSKGLCYIETEDTYKKSMNSYLSQPNNIKKFADRKRIFDMGTGYDEISSQVSLPKNSEKAVTKLASCVSVAALVSGMNVCITRRPQLYADSTDKDRIVNYGPNIHNFGRMINNRNDIRSLPDKIKVLDRIIRIGSKINSVDTCLSRYNIISDREVLIGSRLFTQIQDLVPNQYLKQVCIECSSIDIISSKDGVYGTEIISYVHNVGTKLGKLLQDRNLDTIRTITYDTLNIGKKYNMRSKSEYRDRIIDYIDRSNLIQNSIGDTVQGGVVFEYADTVANMYKGLNSEYDSVSNLSDIIASGIIVRAIIEVNNEGDQE